MNHPLDEADRALREVESVLAGTHPTILCPFMYSIEWWELQSARYGLNRQIAMFYSRPYQGGSE